MEGVTIRLNDQGALVETVQIRLMELGFKLAVARHSPFQRDFRLPSYELKKEEQDESRYRKTGEDEPLGADGAAELTGHVQHYLKDAKDSNRRAMERQPFEVLVDSEGEDGAKEEGAVVANDN